MLLFRTGTRMLPSYSRGNGSNRSDVDLKPRAFRRSTSQPSMVSVQASGPPWQTSLHPLNSSSCPSMISRFGVSTSLASPIGSEYQPLSCPQWMEAETEHSGVRQRLLRLSPPGERLRFRAFEQFVGVSDA